MMAKINLDATLSGKILDSIERIISEGGLIICPTESSYLIGADALNRKAVSLIFRIKERQKNKPLPLIIPNKKFAYSLAHFNPLTEKLTNHFWPGPLTVIFYSKQNVPTTISGNNKKIGMRVPAFSLLIQILSALMKPLISTSANISGNKEPYSIPEEILHNSLLRGSPHLILDAGKLKKNPPSTIVDASEGYPLLIREGLISFDEIQSVLK